MPLRSQRGPLRAAEFSNVQRDGARAPRWPTVVFGCGDRLLAVQLDYFARFDDATGAFTTDRVWRTVVVSPYDGPDDSFREEAILATAFGPYSAIHALIRGRDGTLVIGEPEACNVAFDMGYTAMAEIEFRDVKANKVLWSAAAMPYNEQYDVVTGTAQAGDVNAFLGQDVNAIERLSAEFARAVVSAILEAF